MKFCVFTILFIFSHLILASTTIAQDNNPFEIQSRLRHAPANEITTIDDNQITDTIAEPETRIVEKANPFEIYSRKTEAPSISIIKETSVEKYQFSFERGRLKNAFSGKSSGFLMWLMMLMLIIFAIVVSLNREMTIKLISSAWLNNLMSFLFRNFGSRELLLYFLLYLNFAVNLAIFIYVFMRHKMQFEGFNLFLLVFIFVVVVYLVKHLSLLGFQRIFTTLKEIHIYSFSVMIYNIVLGISLTAVNLFAAFSSPLISTIFIYTGVVLICLFYVFRLFRGFLTTYNYFISSIFHFFMYLCAFEILPLLILYRFFVNF